MPDFTERSQIQLSANALGEYLASPDASEKRRILKENKYRSGGMYHYVWAAKTAKECVLNPAIGVAIRAEALEQLNERLHRAGNPQARVMIQNNILALRRFELLQYGQALVGSRIFEAGDEGQTILVRDVAISVRPDFIIPDASTRRFGLVKLRFSKKHLSADASRFVALILARYGRGLISLFGQLDLNRTFVIGVIENDVLRCSDHNPRTWDEVERGCDEIRALWPLILPPTRRIRNIRSARHVRPEAE
jgi:hypothetical protein